MLQVSTPRCSFITLTVQCLAISFLNETFLRLQLNINSETAFHLVNIEYYYKEEVHYIFIQNSKSQYNTQYRTIYIIILYSTLAYHFINQQYWKQTCRNINRQH